MALPTPTKPSLATLIAAIANVVSIGLAFFLVGNGSNHVDAFITALIGPALASIVVAFQAQQNGVKADTAAVKADQAVVAATSVATTVDSVHTLVNGTLESRVANVVANVLPIVLKEVLAGTATAPPLLAPSALANPSEVKSNG